MEILTMTDIQAKFQDKLRRALGVDDIVIDWSTYHRTPPTYLRNYDPSVCTAFVDMDSDTLGHRYILLYNALSLMCKKNVYLSVFQEDRTDHSIRVSACHRPIIKCLDFHGNPVPGYNHKL